MFFFWGTFFSKNWVWTPELRPGTQKFGFLVKNYPYSEMVRTLGQNTDPNTSIFMFKLFCFLIGFGPRPVFLFNWFMGLYKFI